MKTIQCVKCGKEINGGFYNAPFGKYCPDCWEQRKREERPAAHLQFKGTPGPWRVDKYCGDAVLNATGGSIAELERYYGYDAFYANACLIAAAPELLEAAKLAYAEWGTLFQRPETFRALDAAIRKAIGNE